MCVYDSHFDVCLKLTQCCKSAAFQLKKFEVSFKIRFIFFLSLFFFTTEIWKQCCKEKGNKPQVC